MPAWNSGSSTCHRLPSMRFDRMVRMSARASSVMKTRRSHSDARYSRTSATPEECASKTYSTSLYAPATVSLTRHPSRVVEAERLDTAVAHVLADHLVRVAELGDATLMEPERLRRHR